MKESMIKTFWRDTYQSRSPIPFIISILIVLFVLIHIFDLFTELNVTKLALYDIIVKQLSLPRSFDEYLNRPWSIITFSFLYTDLFKLIFDCLFLYWFGNIFLNFLNKRQFIFLYIAASLLGGLLFLAFDYIPFLNSSRQLSFYGLTFSLAALITAIATVVPQSEIRLFLFGNVSLKVIATIYVGIQLIFIGILDKAAASSLLAVVSISMLYIQFLRNGDDWSLLFTRKNKHKLKVVHSKVGKVYPQHVRHKTDLPNQEEIDAILDKISINGYDNLSTQEKETLFKASKSKE